MQSRDIDRRQPAKVRDANYYYFIEAAIALFVSFIINVFVVAVFAHGLNDVTNNELVSLFWYFNYYIIILYLFVLIDWFLC